MYHSDSFFLSDTQEETSSWGFYYHWVLIVCLGRESWCGSMIDFLRDAATSFLTTVPKEISAAVHIQLMQLYIVKKSST